MQVWQAAKVCFEEHSSSISPFSTSNLNLGDLVLVTFCNGISVVWFGAHCSLDGPV